MNSYDKLLKKAFACYEKAHVTVIESQPLTPFPTTASPASAVSPRPFCPESAGTAIRTAPETAGRTRQARTILLLAATTAALAAVILSMAVAMSLSRGGGPGSTPLPPVTEGETSHTSGGISTGEPGTWIPQQPETAPDNPVETGIPDFGPEFSVSNTTLLRYCGQSTVVYVPDGITDISPNAFKGTSAKVVYVPKNFDSDKLNSLMASDNSVCYILQYDETYLFDEYGVCFTPDGRELLAAPADFSLTSYTIPEGTEVVCTGAFRGVDSLVSVICPDSLDIIESYAFAGCSSLSQFTFNADLQSIYSHAFRETALKEILLPARLKSIGQSAFESCTALETVIIQSKFIDVIPMKAFRGCTSLSSVTLPDTVYLIDEEAFRGCTSLETMTLPGALTNIWDEAFCESGLTSILLPSTVDTIANTAFAYCPHLPAIALEGGVAQLNSLHLIELDKVTLPPFTDAYGNPIG